MKLEQLQRDTLDFFAIRALAALFSFGSAAIHLALAPAHFEEWWGYGWFFLTVAILQGLYAIGLVAPRRRLVTRPWHLIAGIALNLWVGGFYSITRVAGIPFFGPHAGHVEGFAAIDVFAKTLELGTVASLSALLFWRTGSRHALVSRLRWAGTTLLIVVATLTVLLVVARVQSSQHESPFHSDSATGQALAVDSVSPALPTYNELTPLLVRSGWGPRRTSADVLYAPPIFYRVSGEEAPKASLERPTLVFLLAEADHDHTFGLTPEPPRAFLRVDGGSTIEPYQVTVLQDGIEHRTSQFLFPMPEGMSEATLSRGEHTLTFAIPLESAQESVFEWQLPLALPGEATSTTVPDETAGLPVSGLTPLLTRTQEEVQYEGSQGIRLEATYATPAYFAAALPKDAAARYLPERFPVFLLTERLHTADLPGSPPDVVLSLDNQKYKPDLVEEVTTSPHHRVSLVRFPAEAPTGMRHRVMELLLPADAVMTWHLPISYAGLGSRSGPEVTWVWLMAVMGGLIAAMWPCLFQLTAFFIPALGGLSMQEASSSVSFRRRASVVKAALFFVLGFTVVYTIAGALIGSAAERFADMPDFYVWQRYLGIAGGVVIVLLALRVAAQVRAPLVCKMPVLSRMSQRRRPANPLEMMIAGVAFATGCMTCFGAAIVVAMVVYVGLSGSALVGAFTLFLFSMGMGIPLVIAATAMARILPVLARFEKAVRWMGLASSLLMVGFAVLLITGNYMVLTEWVFRALPGPAFR